jgi:hypothetical protein
MTNYLLWLEKERYLFFIIQCTSINVISVSISPIPVAFYKSLYYNSCYSFALFSASALFSFKSVPAFYIYSSHFLFLESRLFHLHNSFISALPWFSLMCSYFNFNFYRFLLVLWFLLFTRRTFVSPLEWITIQNVPILLFLIDLHSSPSS